MGTPSSLPRWGPLGMLCSKSGLGDAGVREELSQPDRERQICGQ